MDKNKFSAADSVTGLDESMAFPQETASPSVYLTLCSAPAVLHFYSVFRIQFLLLFLTRPQIKITPVLFPPALPSHVISNHLHFGCFSSVAFSSFFSPPLHLPLALSTFPTPRATYASLAFCVNLRSSFQEIC